jgi:hypothetical protein
VRAPAFNQLFDAILTLTWPLPFGPPSALYVGSVADPTAALLRVNTDANERFHVISATNLAQAVLEYGAIKLLPV